MNLACADGHPAECMDLSFANQAMGMVMMTQDGKSLRPGVYDVPPALDQQIASLKLNAMGMSFDTLTEAQVTYSNSYLEGT